MISRNALLALSVGLLAGSVSLASADELVTNGDFETGDFTGWTEFGDNFFNGVWDGLPHLGTYSAFFGPVDDAGGGIEQTLAANVGDQLEISFWYVSESGTTPNSMLVTLGNTTILNRVNITETDYQHFTMTMTATEANPVLRFTFVDPPDYIDLDDVSVNRTNGGGGGCHGQCVADYDDGSGTGVPDDGVGIEDLLYYLVIFEQGIVCADVDDGSSTGTTDGGVGIEDLLYYLVRFEAGC